MATLATIFDRLSVARGYERVQPRAAARKTRDLFAVRTLANEDVYFFVKAMDNTTVVRVADPAAHRACWRMLGGSLFSVLFLVALLMSPGLYNLMAGYQIQTLQKEHQSLLNQRAALELDETKLISPQRLEELARIQQFIDPAPQDVVYLEGKEAKLARR